MAEYTLKTPLTEEDVRKLKVGDKVTLEGVIFGIRDANLIRMFDGKVPAPTDLTGAACIHTAPNVRKIGEGKYEPVCIGTTTSSRMDRFTPGLMEQYGVRAVIGKAGMMEASMEAMKNTAVAIWQSLVERLHGKPIRYWKSKMCGGRT